MTTESLSSTFPLCSKATMRAPHRFEITITGDIDSVLVRQNIDEGRALAYLMDRLLTGQSVGEDAFSSWGLMVAIRPR